MRARRRPDSSPSSSEFVRFPSVERANRSMPPTSAIAPIGLPGCCARSDSSMAGDADPRDTRSSMPIGCSAPEPADGSDLRPLRRAAGRADRPTGHSPPFEPVAARRQLFGRGASDDKGQLLHARQSHRVATAQRRGDCRSTSSACSRARGDRQHESARLPGPSSPRAHGRRHGTLRQCRCWGRNGR